MLSELRKRDRNSTLKQVPGFNTDLKLSYILLNASIRITRDVLGDWQRTFSVNLYMILEL